MSVKKVNDVLKQEGYGSSDEFLKDSALLISLARRDQYQAEYDFFAKKYRMEVEEFERLLHQKRGKEDFKKEKDLEDWQFAEAALQWWEEKIKGLKSAKTS
ncbi:MAG: hypothetical protein U9O41_00875 [Candidatus Aerophobetes bacterium]|nr:hypothetical protein [Candidatus Aerophobetes bacterium]